SGCGNSRSLFSGGALVREPPFDPLEGLDDLSEGLLDEVESTLNVRRAVAIGFRHRPRLLIGGKRGPVERSLRMINHNGIIPRAYRSWRDVFLPRPRALCPLSHCPRGSPPRLFPRQPSFRACLRFPV